MAKKMEPRFKIFGEYIKKKRNEKNLTQKQFAEQIKINSKTIQGWERGSNLPKLDIIKDIISVLNIPWIDFFNKYLIFYLGEDLVNKPDSLPVNVLNNEKRKQIQKSYMNKFNYPFEFDFYGELERKYLTKKEKEIINKFPISIRQRIINRGFPTNLCIPLEGYSFLEWSQILAETFYPNEKSIKKHIFNKTLNIIAILEKVFVFQNWQIEEFIPNNKGEKEIYMQQVARITLGKVYEILKGIKCAQTSEYVERKLGTINNNSLQKIVRNTFEKITSENKAIVESMLYELEDFYLWELKRIFCITNPQIINLTESLNRGMRKDKIIIIDFKEKKNKIEEYDKLEANINSILSRLDDLEKEYIKILGRTGYFEKENIIEEYNNLGIENIEVRFNLIQIKLTEEGIISNSEDIKLHSGKIIKTVVLTEKGNWAYFMLTDENPVKSLLEINNIELNKSLKQEIIELTKENERLKKIEKEFAAYKENSTNETSRFCSIFDTKKSPEENQKSVDHGFHIHQLVDLFKAAGYICSQEDIKLTSEGEASICDIRASRDNKLFRIEYEEGNYPKAGYFEKFKRILDIDNFLIFIGVNVEARDKIKKYFDEFVITKMGGYEKLKSKGKTFIFLTLADVKKDPDAIAKHWKKFSREQNENINSVKLTKLENKQNLG